MYCIKYSVDNFIRTYGVIGEKDNDYSLENIVSKSVNMAYDDTKRTLAGIGKYENEKLDALRKIKDEIKLYLEGKKCDDLSFDDFHSKLCNIWCNSFPKESKIGDYGKAQKIINMSFKYAYCWFYKIRKPREKFRECHVPIDSYILKWVVDRRKEIDDENLKRKLEFIKYYTKWSSLDSDQYSIIHEFLGNEGKVWGREGFEGLTPLESEFILWDYLKIKSVEASYKKNHKELQNYYLGNISERYNDKISDGNIELSDFMER